MEKWENPNNSSGRYYGYGYLKINGGWLLRNNMTINDNTRIKFISDHEHKNKPVPTK